MGTKASGNKQAQGQSARYGSQLTVRTRGSILNALDVVDAEAKAKQSKPVSEILAEEFKKNPIKFMDMAAKYIVKDVNITSEPSTAKEMSDQELYEQLTKDGKLAEFVALQARQSRIKPEDQDDQHNEIAL